MGPILQFIRPYDVFDAETLTVLSDAFDKAIASFKTTVNDLSFARQWLSAFWTSRRGKGSATRIACTEQRLVRLYSTIDAEYGRALMSPLPVDRVLGRCIRR